MERSAAAIVETEKGRTRLIRIAEKYPESLPLMPEAIRNQLGA
ncbi:MAG TPA: hypothetical protein VK530_17910 [Candidatus Acidoferrum sp.]|nr:hypothetical protein [Candidatus Acidoferrum sp.]